MSNIVGRESKFVERGTDEIIVPPKLKEGDELRIIAPAGSLKLLDEEKRSRAITHLQNLGFRISFGRHVFESNLFGYGDIMHRVKDLHEAFDDPGVSGILSAIGGFSSNQLLHYIDYELIRRKAKLFCGYSDITVLQNAFLQKAGLVTYSGPHFSTFAFETLGGFTSNHFVQCTMKSTPFELKPSKAWNDGTSQKSRHKSSLKNIGARIFREGVAEGRIIGGNLCTLNLLQGTEFLPSLDSSLLFIEEDDLNGELTDVNFERDLQSLFHLANSSGIKALIIGRFQSSAKITLEKIQAIIRTKKECSNIPVVYGLDFGHTFPLFTFPIGGWARLNAKENRIHLEICNH